MQDPSSEYQAWQTVSEGSSLSSVLAQQLRAAGWSNGEINKFMYSQGGVDALARANGYANADLVWAGQSIYVPQPPARDGEASLSDWATAMSSSDQAEFPTPYEMESEALMRGEQVKGLVGSKLTALPTFASIGEFRGWMADERNHRVVSTLCNDAKAAVADIEQRTGTRPANVERLSRNVAGLEAQLASYQRYGDLARGRALASAIDDVRDSVGLARGMDFPAVDVAGDTVATSNGTEAIETGQRTREDRTAAGSQSSSPADFQGDPIFGYWGVGM